VRKHLGVFFCLAIRIGVSKGRADKRRDGADLHEYSGAECDSESQATLARRCAAACSRALNHRRITYERAIDTTV
jgi:hypothetical protein